MTQITKEAIEAFALAFWPVNAVSKMESCEGDIAKALEAALPFLPIAVEGKVKALVWEYREQQMMTYVVRDYRGVVYHINQTFGSDSYYFTTVKFDGSILYDGDDLPSAQAAAQVDHDAFILSALISSPGKDGGQEVEAVEWQGRYWIEDEGRWSNWITNPVGYRWAHEPQEGKSEIRYLYPQPASTALVDAPSPQSKVDADRLRDLIRWAHETLYEINPSNYDHDEVCKLNDASVEVILGLAVELGEKHGKSDEWWEKHRAARKGQGGNEQ